MRIVIILILAAVMCSSGSETAFAEPPVDIPGRRGDDSRFIESHAGVGAFALYPLYFDTPTVGVDVSITLRPAAARSFYPSFERRNIGMNFAVTYLEVSGQRRFFDASVVFRKYTRRLEETPGEGSPFLGAGFGVMGMAWDSEKVDRHNLSLTGEVGYEYRSLRSMVLTFRLQARRLAAGPTSLSGFGFVVTAGWRTD